jgi:hypothetical protein
VAENIIAIIKQEYPDIPVYWGAFILIEGQPGLKKKAKI